VLRGTGGSWERGKQRGRRGGHTELHTSVGRRRRRLVGVIQGRPAVVQGDSSAPAAGGRWKRVELGQLGFLEPVAGSAAPVGLHAGVSTSAAAVAAGSEWPAAQSGRGRQDAGTGWGTGARRAGLACPARTPKRGGAGLRRSPRGGQCEPPAGPGWASCGLAQGHGGWWTGPAVGLEQAESARRLGCGPGT
jgi:hypothetical protein